MHDTPRWQRVLFILAVITLVFTGFGQMPLYKRYYIADLPGLAWSADFFIVHKVHYIAAAVFMFLVVGAWARRIRDRISMPLRRWVVAGFMAAVIATGVIRTLKNLPDIHFGPLFTLVVDWSHMFFAFGLGAAALVSWLLSRRERRANSPARARSTTMGEAMGR